MKFNRRVGRKSDVGEGILVDYSYFILQTASVFTPKVEKDKTRAKKDGNFDFMEKPVVDLTPWPWIVQLIEASGHKSEKISYGKLKEILTARGLRYYRCHDDFGEYP